MRLNRPEINAHRRSPSFSLSPNPSRPIFSPRAATKHP